MVARAATLRAPFPQSLHPLHPALASFASVLHFVFVYLPSPSSFTFQCFSPTPPPPSPSPRTCILLPYLLLLLLLLPMKGGATVPRHRPSSYPPSSTSPSPHIVAPPPRSFRRPCTFHAVFGIESHRLVVAHAVPGNHERRKGAPPRVNQPGRKAVRVRRDDVQGTQETLCCDHLAV